MVFLTDMTNRRLVLYLLHFSRPVGRARHYLGSTTGDRLTERLREHQRGVGSSLTRRAIELGVTMYLAATIPVASREQEKQFKRRGHLNRVCLICRRGLDEPGELDASFQAIEPLPRATWQPLEPTR